ncbi:hypothetical protein PP715_15600 [Ralstonia solanacearum]|uniref:hypothetical protein n=1 Tax=Ralstonia solanacearum TaxID=305 RepID=UPI0011AEBF3F|nr:hypothetical protein [Ralstonia solanacearum]MBB6588559.1 hypothetical protein [Ralstonia solanacearum]MCL9841176.1 hypothetical protein [Ralstonia solanacearum]MDB0533542.1 hypothetical protein [Ralstonia solanacearum]MDB0538250.1 hypothetical protein [Ralstonia solanacearum]MDB0548158.1 hypothetical protein [Ralstonia solanacearum]
MKITHTVEALMPPDEPIEHVAEQPTQPGARTHGKWILRTWAARGALRPWLKGWIDVLQSMLAIAAIVAAGWWFLAQATYSTKIATALNVETRRLAVSGYTLYSVSIKITNSGFVPVSIDHASVRVERILPLDGEIQKQLEHRHLVHRDAEKTLVDWPMIDTRTKDPRMTLYPGDSDSVLFDLIVPSEVKVIRLHSVIAANKELLPGTATWIQNQLVDAQ